MIYAETTKQVEAKRKAFLRKWRLRCPAVAASLEEAGGRLFAFLRLPPSQWKSARTTNAIERLHEEFKRRIKTQTVLPSAETAAMLFWALMASGQITMRKVNGWPTLGEKFVAPIPVDLAAQPNQLSVRPRRAAQAASTLLATAPCSSSGPSFTEGEPSLTTCPKSKDYLKLVTQSTRPCAAR